MTDKVADTDPKMFADARAMAAEKYRGLDAPKGIIDCVEAACTLSPEEGFKVELDRFNKLREGIQNKALIYQFFAERDVRKIPDMPADVKPLPLKSAAVIGAGTMGSGIAMCFANAGIPVTLIDASADALERGLSTIEQNYARSVKRGSRTQAQMDKALGCIAKSLDIAAVANADIIIEAVFEDMAIKKEMFATIDRLSAPHAILGNQYLDARYRRHRERHRRGPKRWLGTHFFSPANVMRLLENVRGEKTSYETIATVMALGKTLRKIAVLARNCDGFIGNRMVEFYFAQANYLLEEGATPAEIDGAMEEFGMAMGPLATIDLAGLDILHLMDKAHATRRPSKERASPILERLYERGRLGQKAGMGYYRYDGRKRSVDPEVITLIEQASRELGITRRKIPADEIVARLLHPLVNEGARLLGEGIALRPGDVDIVYVHGYGFPAYRGGPMFWAPDDRSGEDCRNRSRACIDTRTALGAGAVIARSRSIRRALDRGALSTTPLKTRCRFRTAELVRNILP